MTGDEAGDIFRVPSPCPNIGNLSVLGEPTWRNGGMNDVTQEISKHGMLKVQSRWEDGQDVVGNYVVSNVIAPGESP